MMQTDEGQLEHHKSNIEEQSSFVESAFPNSSSPTTD